MLVIADTSPLNYLLQIGCLDVLPRLYGRIVTAPEVIAELLHTSAPPPVLEWASHPPRWLEVKSVSNPLNDLGLDAGEAAAISLAVELGADRLLIDERDGRQVARERYRIAVAGTLAVLRDAASAGLIDLRVALNALRQTNFRASPALFDELLGGLPPV